MISSILRPAALHPPATRPKTLAPKAPVAFHTDSFTRVAFAGQKETPIQARPVFTQVLGSVLETAEKNGVKPGELIEKFGLQDVKPEDIELVQLPKPLHPKLGQVATLTVLPKEEKEDGRYTISLYMSEKNGQTEKAVLSGLGYKTKLKLPEDVLNPNTQLILAKNKSGQSVPAGVLTDATFRSFDMDHQLILHSKELPGFEGKNIAAQAIAKSLRDAQQSGKYIDHVVMADVDQKDVEALDTHFVQNLDWHDHGYGGHNRPVPYRYQNLYNAFSPYPQVKMLYRYHGDSIKEALEEDKNALHLS